MISVDRAKKIIQCYGGYPLAWPEQDRPAMQQLLLDSKSLSDLQKEALALDSFMGFSIEKDNSSSDCQFDQQLANMIINKLPEQQQTIQQMPITFIKKCYESNKPIIRFSAPVLLIASVMFLVIGLSASLQFNHTNDAGQLSLSDYMALYVDDTLVFEHESIDDEPLEMLAFLEPQIMDEYN